MKAAQETYNDKGEAEANVEKEELQNKVNKLQVQLQAAQNKSKQKNRSGIKRKPPVTGENEKNLKSQLDQRNMVLRMVQCGIKDIKMNQQASPSVIKALSLIETIARAHEPSCSSEEPGEKKIKLEKEEYIEDFEEMKTEANTTKASSLEPEHDNCETEYEQVK